MKNRKLNYIKNVFDSMEIANYFHTVFDINNFNNILKNGLALKENKGIMGINYCPSFVSDSQVNQIPDIIKHINHIKEVGGIDVIALGRAFVSNIKQKDFKEGGSTITQQTAKNLYFITEDDVDYILELRKQKIPQKEISKITGIPYNTIGNIFRGESWGWYTGIVYTPKNKK